MTNINARPLTVLEFAARVNRSPKTIQRLCASGTIHGEKRGRDWTIPAEEVERYRNEVRRNR